ncbi:TPA: pheST operon leader peptide PheM [Proteus mirabilis]|uniref:pheST attenuator peptide n=5 Tax=Proteus TaxID=583 RepID=A0A6G6T3N9_9GAMM|nr:pheST operon leader peptide PheM [Proteus mirabilis]MBA7798823.1 pheST operon leader peptide PheM [Citrobacter sp. RHBSTW-01065]MBG2838063.1 pheST operon leader peptide PheM [Proteus terrae subsp. cibarius]MBG2874487.1 pheST operon leader peptide PheM [Proteus alimentorum]MBG5948170.1 pheST operon leader peptide PheM [Proteus terrae]MBG6030377.1 pheST operon leader peptide PheM [Proteus hauseri]MBI6215714.1 pheST operon leader peptide PheM [Proteus vulgaris]MBI6337176.1 pheST operon leade
MLNIAFFRFFFYFSA